jgi:hypothetical protein
MKLKDIEIGTDYAYGHADYASRGRAVEVAEHTHRVYSGQRWDWAGHNATAKMVRLVPLRDDGTSTTDGLPRDDVWVRPAKVLHPWSVEDANRDARAAHAAADRDRAVDLGQQANEISERLARLLPADTYGRPAVNVTSVNGLGMPTTPRGSVVLSFEQFEHILELAEHGRTVTS